MDTIFRFSRHWLGAGAAGLFFAASVLACLADPKLDLAPVTASFHLLWTNNQLPENVNDFRMAQLEDAAGITHYIWEMKIPSGKELIIRFTGKASTGANSNSSVDFQWAIVGPLAGGFRNRVCLDRRSMNNNSLTQYLLEINTNPVGTIDQRGINSALGSFERGHGWEGDWGATSSEQIPGTMWEMHLGTKSEPHLIGYKLMVSIRDAKVADKPGAIVSMKPGE